MTAGERRQRVTIQARAEVESQGSYTETWPTVVRSRIAAKVAPLQGRDLERARAVDPRISLVVELSYWRAYRGDLDGGRVQLVYHPTSRSADDRTLEIVGAPVDVDERHEKVVLQCREQA